MKTLAQRLTFALFCFLWQSGPFAHATTFTLGTTNLVLGPVADANSVLLAASPATAVWTASANNPWLHVSSTNESGEGNALIVFSADANPGPVRSGTLTIAGQAVTVIQAGSRYVPATNVTPLVECVATGVAPDAQGDVYIANLGGSAIQEWKFSNSLVTLASGVRPMGAAVDGEGDVYFADFDTGNLLEWSEATGLHTLVASGLSPPGELTLDSAGNVYLAESNAYNVAVEFWAPGTNAFATIASAGLYQLSGVAVDIQGNVYISDLIGYIDERSPVGQSNPTLINLTPNEVPSAFGPVPVVDVAVDGCGNLYPLVMNEFEVGQLLEWKRATGQFISLVTNLRQPNSVAVDRLGNVYYGDANSAAERTRAFVDPTLRLEGAAAGFDQLPSVLPAAENLAGLFAPTTDQPWLSFTGATNGVISFAFSTNSGPSRLAHIAVLGQNIPVLQVSGASPPF